MTRCPRAAISGDSLYQCGEVSNHPDRFHQLLPIDVIPSNLELSDCPTCRLQPRIVPGRQWPTVLCGCATPRQLYGTRFEISTKAWAVLLLDWLYLRLAR